MTEKKKDDEPSVSPVNDDAFTLMVDELEDNESKLVTSRLRQQIRHYLLAMGLGGNKLTRARNK